MNRDEKNQTWSGSAPPGTPMVLDDKAKRMAWDSDVSIFPISLLACPDFQGRSLPNAHNN